MIKYLFNAVNTDRSAIFRFMPAAAGVSVRTLFMAITVGWAAAAAAGPAAVIEEGESKIESLFVRDMYLRDYAELMNRGFEGERKIIVSEEAGDRKIRFFLTQSNFKETLQALCATYGLWYRHSPDNNIIQIMTREEYRRSISFYADETVEVVDVLYPAPEEIGETLARLFQDRVVWTPPAVDAGNDIGRIENALARMDSLSERATLVDPATGRRTGDTTIRREGTRVRRDRTDGRLRSTAGDIRGREAEDVLADREEQLQAWRLQAEAGPTFPGEEEIYRPGLIYISAAPMASALVLRSSDSALVESVKRIIGELDKPRPQVLLEVKVLDVHLDDEHRRGVDWLFQDTVSSENVTLSGGMSRGITAEPGGLIQSFDPDTLLPRGSGIDPLAAVFSIVSDEVRARLQILQDEDRIRSLATPSLLVADNEASRVFIGSEVSVLEKVEPETIFIGTESPRPVTTYTVTSPRKRIGTTLLITPRIHADRTVTIRILQEETKLGPERTIKFGSGADDQFTSQDVEERSVTTTVMARDGHTIAIGGLIRERERERESGIPGLMRLPLIGEVFKRTITTREQSELLVLIQPHVLLAPGEGETVSNRFLRQQHRDYELPSVSGKDDE